MANRSSEDLIELSILVFICFLIAYYVVEALCP